MSEIELSSKTIGKIWIFLEDKIDSVSKIKRHFIEAGVDVKKILEINETIPKKVHNPLESFLPYGRRRISLDFLDPNRDIPDYRSKNDIISDAFKIIYSEYSKSEADGILIEIVRLIIKDNPKLLEQETVQELEVLLESDGIPLNKILGASQFIDFLKEAKSKTTSAGIVNAEEKIAKCLRRLSTDLEGAVTTAESAVEDVCIEVFRSLNIKIPNKKQLPDYLVELRRKTNLENLATIPDHTYRIITPLSTLAENIYHASHEAGDRHGSTIVASQFVRELLIVSCAALIIVITGALKRGELKLKK